MNNQKQYCLFKKISLFICFLLLIIVIGSPSRAQEQPPKPITVKVRNYQPLTFGTFIQSGTYGTVTISPEGARTATGSVILPNISSITTAALFDVESIPGTLITIVNGPDAILTGSNTGTLVLKIGDSYPQSPLISTGEHTLVTIGGTLIVGPLSANAAGNYSGTFMITFIQQ